MVLRAILRLGILTAAAVLSGCGGKSPVGPSTPAGGLLAITCPSPIETDSLDGNGVPVTFEAPRTSNGLPPVSTSCSASSGSQFPIGATVVSCQARDAGTQSASCSFTVRVRAPPRLTFTKYLAFGDSLTEGVVSLGPTILSLDLPSSYPTVLRGLLRARYTTQSLTVVNAGSAGEFASGEGIARFRPTLQQNRPEVVLLMEGTNDLLFQFRGVEPALTALDGMMREAESQNVRVCLATIPPQRVGGLRGRDVVAGLIPGFNNDVRALAARHGAVLVDVYAGMKDDLSLIGLDDLHPTPRGYEVMASIFADAIKRNFEVQQTAGYDALRDADGSASRTMRLNGASR
jgi:lysophospholipase L1-like esterase